MMFRYINMPALVAFYLRDFSANREGVASKLYFFIFCLCLPFVSKTFNRARLNALAIAQCTNSSEQIARVLHALTGADVSITVRDDNFYLPYSGDDGDVYLSFDDSYNEPLMPYSVLPNLVDIVITPHADNADEILAYLKLLIPFYVRTNITIREYEDA